MMTSSTLSSPKYPNDPKMTHNINIKRHIFNLLCNLPLLLFQLHVDRTQLQVHGIRPFQLSLVHHSDVLSMLPLILPLFDQLLLVLLDVHPTAGQFLHVAADLFPPGFLRFVVLLLLDALAQQFTARDLQVCQDDFERGPIARLGAPALFNEQLKALRTAGRNWQVERVVAHAVDDLRRVYVLVWHLTGQQFPQDHPVGPDVDLFIAGLVADYLRCHPGNRTGKAHLCTDVVPLARCSEIGDLDHLSFAYQNAAIVERT